MTDQISPPDAMTQQHLAIIQANGVKLMRETEIRINNDKTMMPQPKDITEFRFHMVLGMLFGAFGPARSQPEFSARVNVAHLMMLSLCCDAPEIHEGLRKARDTAMDAFERKAQEQIDEAVQEASKTGKKQ